MVNIQHQQHVSIRFRSSIARHLLIVRSKRYKVSYYKNARKSPDPYVMNSNTSPHYMIYQSQMSKPIVDDVPQLCSVCRQGILVLSQKGTFCTICHTYTCSLQFQHDTRIVPQAYRPNTKPPPCSRERNAKLHMGSFTQKYGLRSQSQMTVLLCEVDRYLQGASRCRSYKEVCAAIFFYNFRKELKLTLSTFCADNQLEGRVVAKALMKYVGVKNRAAEEVPQQEEGGAKQEDADLLDKCAMFVKSAANEIFNFTYVNEARLQQYTKAVVNRAKKVKLTVDVAENWAEMPALVWVALKSLNHPIKVQDFKQICSSHGISVSKKILREALTAGKVGNKAEGSEPTLEQSTSNLQ